MLQESPIQIDAASWRRWRDDQITQEVFRVLALERQEWATMLLEGDTLLGGNVIADTAKSVGAVYGLDAILIGIEEVLRQQWQDEQDQLLNEKEKEK